MQSRYSSVYDNYFDDNSDYKLHLGAGPFCFPGWLNTDLHPQSDSIYELDASAKLPFDDCTFSVVFSEHLIEHMEYPSGARMLREVYRVLRPGGYVRFSTPDLHRLVGLLLHNNDNVRLSYVRLINHLFSHADDLNDPTFTINSVFYSHGHRFLYTEELLTKLYSNTGFKEIKRFDPLISDIKDLCGLEKHGLLLGDERLNTFECMVIQARNPLDYVS